jgi:hypothetical protein
MTPMRVYLAGPMTGLPNFNYDLFNKIAAEWREKTEHIILNPAEHFDGDTTLPYAVYMKEAAKTVLTADAIALLPGWRFSAGARFELHLAQRIGLYTFNAVTRVKISVPSIITSVKEETMPVMLPATGSFACLC